MGFWNLVAEAGRTFALYLTWSAVFAGLLLGTGVRVASAQRMLELEEVLTSVRAHHPRVAAALARRERAEGALTSARGGFDPVLEGRLSTRDGDGYGRTKANVEILAPTPLWGTEVFGGYRVGRSLPAGDWPSYDPEITLPGGELRAGVRIPLWRGGPIDERRARIAAAARRARAAEQDVAATLLELRQGAMGAYWQWVAAGQVLSASQQLMELAERRGEQLERAVSAGAKPAIDLVDNRRMVFERRESLAAAERQLQRASYALALYYRSDDGRPQPPVPARLPPTLALPPPETLQVEALRAALVRCHPGLRELRAEIEALEAELRLALNRVAPEVQGKLQVSRDLGDPQRYPVLAGTAFEAGINLSMPLALRPERGARTAARAKLREKQADARWLTEQISIEVADLASRVRAAYARYQASRGYLEAAETLAEGERTRFQAGASSLLFVNVREQNVMDAELSLISAALEAHLARASWEALQSVACP